MNAKILKIFIPISLLIILITIGICCLVKKTRQPNPDNSGPNLIDDLKNQLADKNSQPISNNFQFLKPYLTYTVDGDIIREYKLFPEMEPKKKDHAGRLNYFHRQDFINLCEKYQLDIFPVKWTTNKENLGNLEYNSLEYTRDGPLKLKKKHDWAVCKANFNIILTNQPANPPYEMTHDFENKNGFYNFSYCCLNLVRDYEFFYRYKNYCLSNYPYIRFLTKNLECEFDWLVFIIRSFRQHFYSNFKVLDEFMNYNNIDNSRTITKLAENPTRNNLPDNERLFTINKIPKQIIVEEGTPDQHTKTIDIIEIKYDLKTLVDKVNNLHLTTEKEKKNREFINQYANVDKKTKTIEYNK